MKILTNLFEESNVCYVLVYWSLNHHQFPNSPGHLATISNSCAPLIIWSRPAQVSTGPSQLVTKNMLARQGRHCCPGPEPLIAKIPRGEEHQERLRPNLLQTLEKLSSPLPSLLPITPLSIFTSAPLLFPPFGLQESTLDPKPEAPLIPVPPDLGKPLWSQPRLHTFTRSPKMSIPAKPQAKRRRRPAASGVWSPVLGSLPRLFTPSCFTARL